MNSASLGEEFDLLKIPAYFDRVKAVAKALGFRHVYFHGVVLPGVAPELIEMRIKFKRDLRDVNRYISHRLAIDGITEEMVGATAHQMCHQLIDAAFHEDD